MEMQELTGKDNDVKFSIVKWDSIVAHTGVVTALRDNRYNDLYAICENIILNMHRAISWVCAANLPQR